ncbi:PhoH family protein [Nocardiopsis sp. CNR-923]|uniref:PhoH family protein n=1 Tax=Nocardiopsis sp. CNR-923 TaxID=1904965 RepID=UPI000ADC5831|nr:PhoH family protein [Nocardiopsis sp. CNR-923]
MAETTHTQPRRDTQVKVVVPDEHTMVGLLGSGDELLRALERAFESDIHVRGNEFTISGSPEETAVVVRLIEELIELAKSGTHVTPDTIDRMVHMLRTPGTERPADVLTTNILSNRGRTIRPKTVNQKRYVDIIDRHTVVFGIGPAGTGKTYLAMAKAVKALQDKEVNRIILTRPAVEAGERLGFLPGTLYEKIDPYLRPLYDALHDMLDPDSIPKLMSAGTIEVAPLAYMRGRAQPVGTKVLTPEGFRPIGDLRVGDLVVGSNGEPTPVIGVYPQGRKAIYRFSSQDGASTCAPRTTCGPCARVRTPDGAGRTGCSRRGKWSRAACGQPTTASTNSRCSALRSPSPHGTCPWIRTRWACSWGTGARPGRRRRARPGSGRGNPDRTAS